MCQTDRFDEIAENFELFDTWEERYGYVIDLGKEMPALPDELKRSEHKVDGCASQVWLVPSLGEDAGARRLPFQGDSDAMIVRGLIAILTALISGRTVAEIGAMDIRAELDRLHLAEALSSQRSNGLAAMVERIRDIARHAGSG